MFEIFPPPPSTNTSPGVTPGFLFSKDGNTTVGSYLRIGSVISSNAGQPVIGKNRLVKMRVTCQSNAGSNCTFRLRRRTGVSTFVDITGSDIVIPAGSYNASADYDLALPEDVELAAYLVSGSTLSNVVLNVFLYPDYS